MWRGLSAPASPLPFEKTRKGGLTADVAGHGGDHVCTRLHRGRADRRNVEHRVEGEELEHVMVHGTGGERAGTTVVRTGRADLARAVGQLSAGRDVLGKAHR